MSSSLKIHKIRFTPAALIVTGILIFATAVNFNSASAQSPIHPAFPLLDKNGEDVLVSGEPVSTMETCGKCHDTAFIEQHSSHAQVGYDDLSAPGETGSQRAWDTGEGLFGRWNPITYRYLSPPGDALVDLDTPEWLQTTGLRHVGGGPAEEENVEMNCFLCHLSEPDNDARIESLKAGQFEWANTATLSSTGIVQKDGESWVWNMDAFDAGGELIPEFISIQDPDGENCGQCHGLVSDELESPLTSPGCITDAWTTQTTGQIISPQRLSDSGMNLENKEELSRAWDIHAERLLACTDCHYSLNNPVYAQGSGADSLAHLEYDPRRLDIGEYLYQPLHQFAAGERAQSRADSSENNSMRSCDSCHAVESTHEWLPYVDRHMDAINCETCHIPKLYSAAYQQVDWTVVETGGLAAADCRGVEGDTGTAADLVTGFTPLLLQRQGADGDAKITPYNLVSSWFWVYGDPQRPVRLEDLRAAWLNGGEYHEEILALFDADHSSSLEDGELRIDSAAKEALIKSRLEALGLEEVHIAAEVQPYSINHDVANSGWATRDCQTCHSEESLLAQPFQLAAYLPGGVMPQFVKDTNAVTSGELYVAQDGSLFYRSSPEEQALYILGLDHVGWVDWSGAIFFIGTLLGVVGHGGLRVWTSKRSPKAEAETKRVYMYSFYERLWHWLQTFAILILAFTGLIIHKPSMFGMFSFSGVVQVHNILAFILVANAALALFYNMVSGDIRRFIPQPAGFFNQAFEQILFYTRGIFKKEQHPFEKSREKRLNPLQKVTYFGILNVLLPLQVITGILMWGAQRWPQAANALGGLPFLAPFHTLIAWLFASFIVAHVYLTTTGHTPLAGIQSMINGWDELEVHSHPSEEEK